MALGRHTRVLCNAGERLSPCIADCHMMFVMFAADFLRQQAAMMAISSNTGRQCHALTDRVHCMQNVLVRVNAAFSQRCQQAWTEVADEFGSS